MPSMLRALTSRRNTGPSLHNHAGNQRSGELGRAGSRGFVWRGFWQPLARQSGHQLGSLVVAQVGGEPREFVRAFSWVVEDAVAAPRNCSAAAARRASLSRSASGRQHLFRLPDPDGNIGAVQQLKIRPQRPLSPIEDRGQFGP